MPLATGEDRGAAVTWEPMTQAMSDRWNQAHTVSGFIDGGAVDRLHVLVAPVILGSGKPGLALRPIERLHQALRPAASVHVLADGDVLFDCDLQSSP